jgi:hypothetical protein
MIYSADLRRIHHEYMLNDPLENGSEQIAPKLKEAKAVPPPVWKPGVTWDGNEGEITSPPATQPTPHFDDILKSWGYDPEEFEIIEPVKVSTWDSQTAEGTERLWSYKAGVRRKSAAPDLISYKELVRDIKKHRPLGKVPSGDSTFVVCIADTQFGKSDGDGLLGTIKRFQDCIASVENRIRELRKSGRKLGTLVVAGLGDIIEGCDGNYSQQMFTVEANRREQIRIARRLIRDALARWSKLCKNVIVIAVPGNHGENRKDGKSYTERGDNDDVGVFEILAEVLAENPAAYGHVEFRLPKNEISAVLDLNGVIVGFAHGHVTKGGGTPQGRVRNWWEGQSFGNQPVGDAQILLTGHYHHLSVIQYGYKTHIQTPSLDGGSEWWAELSGEESPPGMLTLVVGKQFKGGWTDLLVV